MKKIVLGTLMFILLLTTGCTDMMNTPTKRVEEFLGKYQALDNEVIKQLDSIIDTADTMTNKQSSEYKKLMKKQYQNLSYKIKDETTDGDDATVEVEIEVYDYYKTISEAEDYAKENPKEFLGSNKVMDDEKFMDYKIKQMGNTNDKVKYTLKIKLHKDEDKWVMNNISESDRAKIHGLYEY